MDCRKPVFLALGLLLGAVGCKTTTTTVAMGPTAHPPPGAKVETHDTPRKPKAETLVSLAKVRMGQADEAKVSNAEQIKLRDQARQYYQDALKLDSHYMPAYRGLAQVYLKLKDTDRAVDTLQAAIKVNGKIGELWADLAMCHSRRKEYDQAVQCLNKALEIEPENREYAKVLGLTLARADRIEQSITVLSKAYGADYAHYTVARMLYQMNQDDACKEHLRLTLEANPNHHDARDMLSSLEGGGSAASAPPSSATAELSSPTPKTD